MKSRDLIKLSTRMFKARTGRTLLTVLGMGIGIGAILFLVGLGYGLQNILLKAITTSDSLLALDVSLGKDSEAKLDPALVANIEKIEGVAEVVPVRDVRSQLKFQNVVTDATAVATTPTLLRLEGKKMAAGEENFDGNGKSIVISSAFAQVFGVSAAELEGKEMSFSLLLPQENVQGSQGREKLQKVDMDSEYKIIGIVESDELAFFVSEKNISGYLEGMPYSRLKVKCQSSEFLDGVKNKLQEEGFSVSSLSDTVKEVNKMFQIVKIVLAFFGLISLLVSAIGMFNTMTVALLERTKEIGIMKSIGASEGNILSMFIIESATMGFLGGVAGVVLGMATGGIANNIVNLIAWKMGGQKMALFYFPPWFVLFILGFSLLIGLLTGVVPARRASAIDPLDALMSK